MKSLFAFLLSFLSLFSPFSVAGNRYPEADISKSEAKAIVLEHAELDASDVRRYKVETDNEHGRLVYEIDFDSGRYEYEYTVDAENGKILKAEKEFRD